MFRSFPRKRESRSFFPWLWIPAFAGTSGIDADSIPSFETRSLRIAPQDEAGVCGDFAGGGVHSPLDPIVGALHRRKRLRSAERGISSRSPESGVSIRAYAAAVHCPQQATDSDDRRHKPPR